MIRPAHALIAALALLAACASGPGPVSSGLQLPTLFSMAGITSTGIPEGWKIYRLLRFKPLTAYEVVKDEGVQVVHCEIEHSIVLERSHLHDVEGRIESSLIGRDVVVTAVDRKPRAHRLMLGDTSRVELS